MLNPSISEMLHITWEYLKMLNLGFRKPTKDQCSTCITYTNRTAEEKHKNTD